MKETTLWILQLLAGVVLLILMALHMGLMHLPVIFGFAEPTSWSEVARRAHQVFYIVLYILALGFALYHGFYGLRNILYELSISKPFEKTVSVLIWIVGIALFIYGTYTVVVTSTA